MAENVQLVARNGLPAASRMAEPTEARYVRPLMSAVAGTRVARRVALAYVTLPATGSPVVVSVRTKLETLTPLTASLKVTVTAAVRGTVVPVGRCEVSVGAVRSTVTPQAVSTVPSTPTAGATC